MPEINPTARHVPCTSEEYHGGKVPGISNSELKLFAESPELYHGQIVTGEFPRKESSVLDFGIVFHDLVLQPDFKPTADNFLADSVAMWDACVSSPRRSPDLQTGDALYWTGRRGVHRESDHWGAFMNGYWGLRFYANDGSVATGYCPYERFLKAGAFVAIPPHVLAADGSKRGKAYGEFFDLYADSVALKESEFEVAARMVQSARDNPAARHLLWGSEGLTEYTICWTCPTTGVERRVRIDRLLPNVIVDLKSCASSNPRKFSMAAATFGYHKQAAFYQDGVEALTGERLKFYFIAVEKEPPFACRVIELEEKFVDLGREENTRDLLRFRDCLQSGVWHDSRHGLVQTIPGPGFAWDAFNWNN